MHLCRFGTLGLAKCTLQWPKIYEFMLFDAMSYSSFKPATQNAHQHCGCRGITTTVNPLKQLTCLSFVQFLDCIEIARNAFVDTCCTANKTKIAGQREKKNLAQQDNRNYVKVPDASASSCTGKTLCVGPRSGTLPKERRRKKKRTYSVDRLKILVKCDWK